MQTHYSLLGTKYPENSKPRKNTIYSGCSQFPCCVASPSNEHGGMEGLLPYQLDSKLQEGGTSPSSSLQNLSTDGNAYLVNI